VIVKNTAHPADGAPIAVNDPTVLFSPSIKRRDVIPLQAPLPNPFDDQNFVNNLAKKAYFVFKINFHDVLDIGVSGFQGNDILFSAQGVASLNNILALFNSPRYPKATYYMETGLGQSAAFRPVTYDDVVNVKNAFISYFGNVDKIDYSGTPSDF